MSEKARISSDPCRAKGGGVERGLGVLGSGPGPAGVEFEVALRSHKRQVRTHEAHHDEEPFSLQGLQCARSRTGRQSVRQLLVWSCHCLPAGAGTLRIPAANRAALARLIRACQPSVATQPVPPGHGERLILGRPPIRAAGVPWRNAPGLTVVRLGLLEHRPERASGVAAAPELLGQRDGVWLRATKMSPLIVDAGRVGAQAREQ